MSTSNGRWVRGFALRAALVAAAVAGVGCGQAEEVVPEAETVARTGAVSSNPWTKIANAYPGGAPGPSNLALLTDGTVLASAPYAGNFWYRLTPTNTGSYASGGWSVAQSSNMGRLFSPSFVLRDGKYLVCGGEYVDDRYELATHPLNQGFANCEAFDSKTGLWTALPPMPEALRDSAATELDDGRVLGLSYVSGRSFALSSFGVTPVWNEVAGYDRNAIGSEGDCLTIRDGSAFCGYAHYTRYLPGSNTWSPVPDPSVSLLSNPPNFAPELGPILLLYGGRVMVLGANSQNSTNKNADSALYNPFTNTWSLAAAMPASNPPFNHGDSPATVMRDGRVLVTSTNDETGAGGTTSILHEYDVTANTWTAVPVPANTTWTIGPYLRMLNLPNGQVLVAGTNDGSMWLYTPNGTPTSSWRPTITSISAPSAGEFTLTGTQLNGLTTGSNFGDDNKAQTNYPIVYLTDTSGHRYYARSYNFSHMAPNAGVTSTCKFTLPNHIPNGTYTVQVSANGLESTSTKTLTVGGNHVSTISLSGFTSGAVNLASAAPAGGTVVTLSSSDPNAISVPSTVTVLAGSTSRSFSGTVNGFGTAMITASISNSSFKPAQARMGWTVKSISGPSSIYGDRAAVTALPWSLTLSGPAPANAVVSLSSSNTIAATVPTSVTVPAGASTVGFTVTKAGSTPGLAAITASVRGQGLPYTFSNRDVDFYKCADEGGKCASTLGVRYIAFGANGHYNYKTSLAQFTDCSTTFFGDIDTGGAPRACYLAVYGWAGDEGSSITLSSARDVAYGYQGGFVYKKMSGTFTCSYTLFNADPSPGDGKSCYVGPDTNAFDFAGDEGSTLTGLNNAAVAYGANGHFAFGIASGTVGCNNGTFGDPAVDAIKSCYVLKYPRLVADEYQTVPGNVSTMLYGSGLNGNFIWEFSLGPGASCNNSFVGGDPDVGFLKHCWAP